MELSSAVLLERNEETKEAVKGLDCPDNISLFVQKILQEDSRAGDVVLDLFVTIKKTKKNLDGLSKENQELNRSIRELFEDTIYIKTNYTGLIDNIKSFNEKINDESLKLKREKLNKRKSETPKFDKEKSVTRKKVSLKYIETEKKNENEIFLDEETTVKEIKRKKELGSIKENICFGKGEPECPICGKILVTELKKGEKTGDVKYLSTCKDNHLITRKFSPKESDSNDDCVDIMVENKGNYSITLTAKEVVDILLLQVTDEVSSRPRSEIVGYFHNQMNFGKGESNINLSESMTQTNCDFCESPSDQENNSDEPGEEEKDNKMEDRPIDQDEDSPIFEGHRIICWNCGEKSSKEIIEIFEECQEFVQTEDKNKELEKERDSKVDKKKDRHKENEDNNSSEDDSVFEEALSEVHLGPGPNTGEQGMVVSPGESSRANPLTAVNGGMLSTWVGNLTGKIKTKIRNFGFGNREHQMKVTGPTSSTVEVTFTTIECGGGFDVIVREPEDNAQDIEDLYNWSQESFTLSENDYLDVKSNLEEDDMEEFRIEKTDNEEKERTKESNFSLRPRGIPTKATTKGNKIPFYEILKYQPKQFCQHLTSSSKEMDIHKEKKIEDYGTTLAINLKTSSEKDFTSEPELIIKNSSSDLVLYIHLDVEDEEEECPNAKKIDGKTDLKKTEETTESKQPKIKKLKVDQEEVKKLIEKELSEGEPGGSVATNNVEKEKKIEKGEKENEKKVNVKVEEGKEKVEAKDVEKEKKVDVEDKEKEKKVDMKNDEKGRKVDMKNDEKGKKVDMKNNEKGKKVDRNDDEKGKKVDRNDNENGKKPDRNNNENGNKPDKNDNEKEKKPDKNDNEKEKKFYHPKEKEKKSDEEDKEKDKKPDKNDKDNEKKVNLENKKDKNENHIRTEEEIKEIAVVENLTDKIEKERKKKMIADKNSDHPKKTKGRSKVQEKTWKTSSYFYTMTNKLKAQILFPQIQYFEVYRVEVKTAEETLTDYQEVFRSNEELTKALELIHKIENEVVSVKLSNAVLILPQLELELRKHLQQKMKAINSKQNFSEGSTDSFFSASHLLTADEEETKTSCERCDFNESSEERLKNLLKLLTNLEEAVKSNAHSADKIELCDHNSSKIYQLLHALTTSIRELENENSIAHLENTLNIASQLDTEVRKYDSIMRKLPADYVGIEISYAENEIKEKEKFEKEKDELSMKNHLKNVRKKVFEMVEMEALTIDRKMEKDFDRIECLEKENDETLRFIEAFLDKSEQRVIEQSNVKKELKQLSNLLSNIFEEMTKTLAKKKVTQEAEQQTDNVSQTEQASVQLQPEPVKDTVSSLLLALDKLKTKAKLKKEACREILGGIEIKTLSKKSSRTSKSSFTTTASEDLVCTLKEFKPIGNGSLYLCWTSPEGPLKDLVVGYEILVNGKLNQKVRNPNRLQAVLYSVNLNDGIRVQLYAVIQNGPKILLAETTYQKNVQLQE